jgi:hypothetical protein
MKRSIGIKKDLVSISWEYGVDTESNLLHSPIKMPLHVTWEHRHRAVNLFARILRQLLHWNRLAAESLSQNATSCAAMARSHFETHQDGYR